jgi:hypothetical protein
MNPAEELLHQPRSLGAVFTVNGGSQVKVSAPTPLPKALMAELQKHKPELITLLHQQPDYSLTACICDKTSDGTGPDRCGVCGLFLICPVCTRCRGCKLKVRFGKRSNRCDATSG